MKAVTCVLSLVIFLYLNVTGLQGLIEDQGRNALEAKGNEAQQRRKPLPHGPWRDLTQSELDAWYSPFDQCMMNSSDFDKSPQQIKRESCSSADVKIQGKIGYCRVGMGSNKKECSSPYSGRRTFRRGVDGFTDASATPLIEAFQRVSTNTKLATQ